MNKLECQVDLSNCDREPIHVSGAVQPHGVLLVLDPHSFGIVRLSRNTDAWFHWPWERLLLANVSEVLDAGSVVALRGVAARSEARIVNPLRVRTHDGRSLSASVQLVAEGLLVELEDTAADEGPVFRDFQARARVGMARLQQVVGVEAMCRQAVEELRELTGFDRVMTYRFDHRDNGHVIAESRRADLESYLDLHYPASDIPAQARRLYTINRLRAIVDVNYEPVPIEPTLDPKTSQPLDLSFSILRSVSPIHVQYLKNMGVASSLSISVVVNGRLWGLFICHHYAPRLVPYEVRVTCELYSQMLSWQIAAQERADRMEQRAVSDGKMRRLLEVLTASMDLEEGLTRGQSDLLALVDADGAALVHAGTITAFGATPAAAELERITAWLLRQPTPFASDQFPASWPEAASFAQTGSGLLAVKLDRDGDTQLLWFRLEVVQTVNWAGDPNKTASLRDGAPRLSPRGSFALWKETVRERSLPWQPWQVDVATDFGHAVAGVALKHLAVLAAKNRELRASAEALRAASLAKDEFLAVVSHELRTPLSAMLGWVRLLQGGQLDAVRAAHGLDVVERNARAQARLIEDLLDVSRIITGKMRLDLQVLNLLDVVRMAVDAVKPSADAKSISLTTALDPGATIVMGDAARLQQVLWNLLTNAVKFTSLGGRVSLLLMRVDASAQIIISDNGEGISPEFLPHVFERFRQADGNAARVHQGLGLGLAIVRHLVELHGGTVAARSDGKGLGAAFEILLPLAPMAHVEATGNAAAAVASPHLGGLRVLLVEDEVDSREVLVAELSQLGAEVLAVDSAQAALSVLAESGPDVIISDIGMAKMDGYAFIAAVRQLPATAGGQIPAIALTAFGSSRDRTRAFLAGFHAHMPKPVEPAELAAAILSLAKRRVSPAARA